MTLKAQRMMTPPSSMVRAFGCRSRLTNGCFHAWITITQLIPKGSWFKSGGGDSPTNMRKNEKLYKGVENHIHMPVLMFFDKKKPKIGCIA